MNKQEAFIEINKLQDEYVNELIGLINSSEYSSMKAINFTSPTGTGKTKMMSKLIDRLPEYYFIITTLSKGQLNRQVRDSLIQDCDNDNFIVYGSADYRINSRLEADDILSRIPKGKECIWLRDEGHIRTNRFEELLADRCYKVINFSATNIHSDIQCNFTQTMMLRTVNQTTGTPEQAIRKLIEIKKMHKNIPNYNPCAIFRCVGNDDNLLQIIITLCNENKLKYIDITNEDYIMAELCEDDNEYDVIINKFKLIEGIDIRRAHVLYMDNQPSNNATIIQAIGRCRRNALLYRDDIDILAPENDELLKATRECYVYYNVEKMKVATDENGELQYAFCNYVSCQELKANTTIDVVNGQLSNGLYVIELQGKTGSYSIKADEETGFNTIEPATEFYDTVIKEVDNNYVYIGGWPQMKKVHTENIKLFPIKHTDRRYNRETGSFDIVECDPYYSICENYDQRNASCEISDTALELFTAAMKKYSREYIYSKIADYCIDILYPHYIEYDDYSLKKEISAYISENSDRTGRKKFCQILLDIQNKRVDVCGFTYSIHEICSEKELLILQSHCISKKNSKMSNDDIVEYVKQAVKSRCAYFRYKYYSRQQASLVLGTETETTLSLSEMTEYVSSYKRNHPRDENDAFNRIVYMLEDRFTQEYPYIQLKQCCIRSELLLIQYLCVKAKENNESDEVMMKHLNDIVALKKNFYCSNYGTEAEIVLNSILDKDIQGIYTGINPIQLSLELTYPEKAVIDNDYIRKYFEEFDAKLERISASKVWFMCFDDVFQSIVNGMNSTKDNLTNGQIDHLKYSYEPLFETVSDTEEFLIRNKYIRRMGRISKRALKELVLYTPYKKVVNDRESAIIGVDLMKQISIDNTAIWIESSNVSSKIENYNKFNSFLTTRYKRELEQAKSQCFKGKNNFALDKKCNSIVGYCVEYYSKYLVYGESYLGHFIELAKEEANSDVINDCIIIRACMLKYKELMVLSFGKGVSKLINVISAQQIVKEKYSYFVKLVVELGSRTASFVMKELYHNEKPVNNYDPDLSIEHISGLADYITEDTILDVKVRNYIDEKCVRQVLAYHYLSTKRSDLRIKRVIVYDATSDRAVEVNIPESEVL